MWDEHNKARSWDETIEYAALLDLEIVPVIYDGVWNESLVRNLEKTLDLDRQEGYVVRLTDSFGYGAFRKSVAKFVRKQHVGTAHNWMMQQVVKNELGDQ